MNKAIEIGRLTRDPEVRYSQGNNTAVARYTIAVDRKFKREGEQTADFIPCVVFGKQAEFAEKYFRKGTKVVISGRITTGSYTNKDGQKIYTTEITVEEQEFAESKGSSEAQGTGQMPTPNGDGFMSVPDDDTGLPFNENYEEKYQCLQIMKNSVSKLRRSICLNHAHGVLFGRLQWRM